MRQEDQTSETEPIGDKIPLRTCKSCIHNKTCKLLRMSIDTIKAFNDFAEAEGIEVKMPIEADQIAQGCPEYMSPLALTPEPTHGA